MCGRSDFILDHHTTGQGLPFRKHHSLSNILLTVCHNNSIVVAFSLHVLNVRKDFVQLGHSVAPRQWIAQQVSHTVMGGGVMSCALGTTFQCGSMIGQSTTATRRHCRYIASGPSFSKQDL